MDEYYGVMRAGVSLYFSFEICAILEGLLIQMATALCPKVWLQMK